MMPIWGGIEGGGTKFVCIVGTGPDDVRAEMRFPTTSPEETLGLAIRFFQRWQEKKPLAGIGISSFGPVDVDPDSPTHGYITNTPKPGWPYADVAGTIADALKLPVGFDTDTNGAALGEHRWGAAQGLDHFVYLTVGTGIGGGGLVNGLPMHGLVHPEMGHVRIPHDWANDPYSGCCPYHGDCLEGLACGPALEKRWGMPGDQLGSDHPAWELEARYLALGIVNFICTLSPQRIIMGGGVMRQSQLFPMVRGKVLQFLNDYVQSPSILEHLDEYIVPPGLGNRSGVLGAIVLAQQAAG